MEKQLVKGGRSICLELYLTGFTEFYFEKRHLTMSVITALDTKSMLVKFDTCDIL